MVRYNNKYTLNYNHAPSFKSIGSTTYSYNQCFLGTNDTPWTTNWAVAAKGKSADTIVPLGDANSTRSSQVIRHQSPEKAEAVWPAAQCLCASLRPAVQRFNRLLCGVKHFHLRKDDESSAGNSLTGSFGGPGASWVSRSSPLKGGAQELPAEWCNQMVVQIVTASWTGYKAGVFIFAVTSWFLIIWYFITNDLELFDLFGNSAYIIIQYHTCVFKESEIWRMCHLIGVILVRFEKHQAWPQPRGFALKGVMSNTTWYISYPDALTKPLSNVWLAIVSLVY